MKQHELYIRAVPKKILIIEEYEYKRLISINSFYEQDSEPLGKIEMIIPYDGDKYFSHQALQDFEHQVYNGINGSKSTTANIGYLAISDYENTTLNEISNQIKQYDSLKVSIPVQKQLLDNNKIISDEYICKIHQPYRILKSPEVELIKLNIQILDDASYLDVENINSNKTNGYASRAEKVIQKVKYNTPELSQLLGKLLITFDISLYLPFESEQKNSTQKIQPFIRKLSIKWPTVTSLDESNMGLFWYPDNSQSHLPKSENIKYGPSSSSIDAVLKIPLKRKKTSDSISDICIYTSPQLILAVGQPGELYDEPYLEGEVEVEVEGQLLSGLRTRYYGFDGEKIGQQIETDDFRELSKITTKFELALDEVFQKREHCIRQELNFGSIIPDDNCIRLITNELSAQGFALSYSQKISFSSNKADREESRWLIGAECSVGIDKLKLEIVIHGMKVITTRESKQGDTQYTSSDESGDLTLYLYAKFPGNNYIPTKKINSLQAELRKQFSKLRRTR